MILGTESSASYDLLRQLSLVRQVSTFHGFSIDRIYTMAWSFWSLQAYSQRDLEEQCKRVGWFVVGQEWCRSSDPAFS